jgi:uncharacterized protein (DUF2141 family)
MGLAALLTAAAPAAADPATASLEVTVQGIKSAKGVIRLAVCPPQASFPDCKTKEVRTATLPIANGTARIVLSGLAPGSYAISVFHDANANSKLDTFMGIPKEGYGFSRNPPFKPRAPRFAEAQIDLAGQASTVINLRYLL